MLIHLLHLKGKHWKPGSFTESLAWQMTPKHKTRVWKRLAVAAGPLQLPPPNFRQAPSTTFYYCLGECSLLASKTSPENPDSKLVLIKLLTTGSHRVTLKVSQHSVDLPECSTSSLLQVHSTFLPEEEDSAPLTSPVWILNRISQLSRRNV